VTDEDVAKKEGMEVVTNGFFMKMLEDYAPPGILKRFK